MIFVFRRASVMVSSTNSWKASTTDISQYHNFDRSRRSSYDIKRRRHDENGHSTIDSTSIRRGLLIITIIVIIIDHFYLESCDRSLGSDHSWINCPVNSTISFLENFIVDLFRRDQVTPTDTLIYLIVKINVLITEPTQMEIVLRKRIAVTINKAGKWWPGKVFRDFLNDVNHLFHLSRKR